MAELVLFPEQLNELLHGPTGPVYRVTRAFADEVVNVARAIAPLGFDQGGRRTIGLLKAGMGIHGESVGPEGISFTVGTDPINPKDGYHYGYVTHQGRGHIISAGRRMQFMTPDGEWHDRREVGGAIGQPFLYDAVDLVDASGFDPPFKLIKTPGNES